MPQLPNSYAKQPTQQKQFYDRTLLSRLLPELVFMQFGQTDKRTIPKKEGDTINLRRMNKFPPATTPLVSGVTPAGRNLSFEEITATVKQYGDYVILTDLIELMGIDPIVTETLEAQGEQAGETLDMVVRNEVCKGTNVLYLTPGLSSAATWLTATPLPGRPFAGCARSWPGITSRLSLAGMWRLSIPMRLTT